MVARTQTIKTLKRKGSNLLLSSCFLTLLRGKGGVLYYDTDREGEYLPGTFRYDRVGARNHCMRRAEAENSDTDPT